ncbi:hypothetical protein, partial [Bordetella pertussis]|uniref:hypothetical protein n=1 Tax=Bordetella pertussis TaxID=520 RepID=UPI0018A6C9A1
MFDTDHAAAPVGEFVQRVISVLLDGFWLYQGSSGAPAKAASALAQKMTAAPPALFGAALPGRRAASAAWSTSASLP